MQSKLEPRRLTPAFLVALGALALGPWASAQSALAPDSVEPVRLEAAASFLPVVLEGRVFGPDGAPAEGAVVVSSAGGSAVADRDGCYRLEARVPPDAETVQVTAVGRTRGNPLASTRVGIYDASGLAQVGPLALVMGSTCTPSWLP